MSVDLPADASTRPAIVRHLFDYVRIAVLGSALVFALAIDDGQLNFTVHAVLLSISLALSVAARPRFFRLSMAWTVAFLQVIALEGIFDASAIAADLTPQKFATAASYIDACNAVILLVHAVVFRERRVLVSRRRDVVQLADARYVLGFLVVNVLGYVAYNLPTAMSMLDVGRIGTFKGATGQSDARDVILSGLAVAAGLAAPAMLVYVWTIVRRAPVWVPFALATPVFVIQIALGTRFVLLISLLGFGVMYLSEFPLTVRSITRMSLVSLAGLAGAGVMRQVRAFGLASSEWDLSSALKAGDFEGCVRVMTQLVDWFGTRPHLGGSSIASIFIFWIPRQFWPDKPALLGWWFPRAYGSARGFSVGHSVAGGFSADAYVDFGFWGGLAVCAFAGLLFAVLEAWCEDVIRSRRPTMVIATTLYGAAFFAVRSPDTALIAMSGVVVLTLLFSAFVRRGGEPVARPSPEGAATGPSSAA